MAKMIDEITVSLKVEIGMDFGTALTLLKSGFRVARRGWNGKNMWIALQVPDSNSKMTLPYLFMKTADDQLVPWLASQTDILAEDWVIVKHPSVNDHGVCDYD